MNAADILNELPRLNETERRTLLAKLLELARRDEELRGSAQTSDRFEEAPVPYGVVHLPDRGIDKSQAANLRARLQTFAADWDRPEASIYDEDPAR